MKTIVAVLTILALLAPAHVFASDSSSRFALDREWKIQQAQQRELDARFKAAEADATKPFKALERKSDAGEATPIYPQ